MDAQRFKEHRNAFKSNRNTSNYAKHAIEHLHPFGPIRETMQILQCQGKGAHLNTVERYFIYKEFSNNSSKATRLPGTNHNNQHNKRVYGGHGGCFGSA